MGGDAPTEWSSSDIGGWLGAAKCLFRQRLLWVARYNDGPSVSTMPRCLDRAVRKGDVLYSRFYTPGSHEVVG